MGKEQRRHVRAEITVPVVVMTPRGPSIGEIRNLSLGGAFICSSEVPVLDDNFRLVMKPADRQYLLATAQKIWSDTYSEDKSMFHGMGVSFKYLPDDDRQFIGTMIADHH